ncbi:GST N-terminal domain-containing protein [Mycena sanguinolenta]|uniref:GST N-terminal domain-containing protein n=1 Tax=Mycena sanguinolenta TaxID=230812 RepID=A0A8H7CSS1_9AGAR|nr:GST N-terminal domain-containing protein [Mycena sanguinolenta]
MSIDPIILYDIPSKAPGCAWSPNTWKIRYALNYKALAYKTEWIEYPDIADFCKKIGAEPSMTRRDGSPYYSLPVIQDPKTGAIISDSTRIAEYLDSTYPDTPKLIPAGTHVLQKTFCVAYDNATEPLVQFIIPSVTKILRPRSEEYFLRTRELSFAWKEVEAGFGKVDRWLNESMNAGKPYIMGDVVSFADFMLAGELQWCMRGFGEESDLWKDMLKWHEGRWARLVENLKKYEGPLEDMTD